MNNLCEKILSYVGRCTPAYHLVGKTFIFEINPFTIQVICTVFEDCCYRDIEILHNTKLIAYARIRDEFNSNGFGWGHYQYLEILNKPLFSNFVLRI